MTVAFIHPRTTVAEPFADHKQIATETLRRAWVTWPTWAHAERQPYKVNIRWVLPHVADQRVHAKGYTQDASRKIFRKIHLTPGAKIYPAWIFQTSWREFFHETDFGRDFFTGRIPGVIFPAS